MPTLVIIRHGQSVWNQENKFTGWRDVDLSEVGVKEAMGAGVKIKNAGLHFDVAYTSVLKRAIRTLWNVLEVSDQMWIPVKPHWRLNERHYGALQGLNKAETAAKYGDEQVHIWRRSYDVKPPAVEKTDERWAGHDPRYAQLRPDEVPQSECLKDTLERVMPIWNDEISADLKAGKRVLIVAHGNSLRSLMKHLDKISDQDIMNLEIPTGAPIVYELNQELVPYKSYYL